MRIKKEFVILSIMFLGLLHCVAASTEIQLQTVPNYNVSIYVLEPTEEFHMLQSFHVQPDENGKTTVTYTGDAPEVRIMVNVKIGNTIYFTEKTDTLQTDQPIYLEVPARGNQTVQTVNETASAATSVNITIEENQTAVNITINETPSPAALTGHIIDEENTTPITNVTRAEKEAPFTGGNSSIFFIILTAIIAAGIFGLYMYSRNTNTQAPMVHPPVQAAPQRTVPANLSQLEQRRLYQAERKLRGAQEEINRLQNKKDITQLQQKISAEEANLQKKIQEDRKELNLLKHGKTAPKFKPFRL